MAVSSVAYASSQAKHHEQGLYVVQPGETAWQIAARYNITPEKLIQLNPNVPAREMRHLQAGISIRVPHSGVSTLPDMGMPEVKNSLAPRDTQDNNLAQNLMQASGLANARTTDARNNMVVGKAAAAAGAQVEQFLGQLGTARVQLGMDSKLRTEGSSVDALIPLYAGDKSIFFTQFGWRNIDDRNTVNLGAGVRLFSDDWMYGANIFHDNDFTGHNRRVGLGAEAWTSNLKLSGNYYLSLTNWHQSRDFADYDERPANGWDVRAEGWLPAYPQLGGKLMYEKYRGNEVALFGKNERQKDPYALTAGVNWTPFPLITVGVDHKAGKGGADETSLNAQLTWRMGDSLQAQVSGDNVAASRTLASNRTALVERNNNIVLDYRKQELIRLSLPAQVSGQVAQTVSLAAQVTAKYGLSHIEWTAPDFIADGGSMKTVGSNLTIALPSIPKDKLYTLSAIAWDNKGNVSNRVSTSVLVNTLHVNKLYSVKTITPDIIPADGRATATVHLTLRDDNKQAIVSQAKLLKSIIKQEAVTNTPLVKQKSGGVLPGAAPSIITKSPEMSAYREVEPGEYEAIYTAGDQVTEVTITTLLNDVNIQSINVKQTQLTDIPGDITTNNLKLVDLKLDKLQVLANGTDVAHANVRVVDLQGNPKEGVEVLWDVSASADIKSSSVSNADGIAENEISSKREGSATVSAKLNAVKEQANIEFITDQSTVSSTDSSLKVLSDNAYANGQDPNSILVKVTDAHGNPIVGQQVSLSADNEAMIEGGIKIISMDENGQGIIEVTNTRAGKTTVTVSLNGTTRSVDVNFRVNTGSAGIASGGLTVIKNNAKADGVDSNLVHIKVTDANSNPVPGQSIVLTVDNGIQSLYTVVTGDDGAVTVPVTSRVAGNSVVSVSVNGNSSSVVVTFDADNNTSVIKALVVQEDGALADGRRSNLLQVTVTDAYDNPLSGEKVSLTADNGAVFDGGISSVTTGTDGRVTFKLLSTIAGKSTVTARLNTAYLSVPVKFVANTATATIGENDLKVIKDGATADGSDSNLLLIRVSDSMNNPVSGQTVVVNASSGVITGGPIITGEDGTVMVSITSRVAGGSMVNASVNGTSSAVNVIFKADDTTAAVRSLHVLADGALADGAHSNVLQIMVSDLNGNPLSGRMVSLSVDNSALFGGGISSITTGVDGKATVAVFSTKAGKATVTAGLDTSSFNATVNFVANTGTALIAAGDLSIIKNNATADGIQSNIMRIHVTDAMKNPVPNQVVVLTADNGAVPLNKVVKTDVDGMVTVPISSRVAGRSMVSASVNGISSELAIIFEADTSTANIRSLIVRENGALSDGIQNNMLELLVADVNGNPVSNQTVRLSADNGAVFSGGIDSVMTDSDGRAMLQVSSKQAGRSTITARINNSSLDAYVEFVANSGTAAIAIGDLKVVQDNANADGLESNIVNIRVTDATNNPVSDQTIVLTADNGAVPVSTVVLTGTDGTVSVRINSRVAGSSTVSASINGKISKVTVIFKANSSTAIVRALLVQSDGALAVGTRSNVLRVTVTDANGNPLSGETVSLSATNNATFGGNINSVTTGAGGRATLAVFNTHTGISTVTATLNGTSLSTDVKFVANASTATISAGDLKVIKDGATADGSDSNIVRVRVTDAFNNPVPNQTIKMRADNGATIGGSVPTGADGTATFSITNKVAGSNTVEASVNSNTSSVTVTFKADITTAAVSALLVQADGNLADGVHSNVLRVAVADANDNPLSEQVVSLSVNNNAIFSGGISSVTTNSKGLATFAVLSTKAGKNTIKASLGSSSLYADVRFVANSATANIAAGDLTLIKDAAKSDGVDKNIVQIRVSDARNNPISGQTVILTADNSAVPASQAIMTGPDGTATVSVSSKVAGSSVVEATVNGTPSKVTMTFKADITTASITSLIVQADGNMADGIRSNVLRVTVADSNGNPLSDQTVNLNTNNGAVFGGGITSVKTGTNGRATFAVLSTRAGNATVTASLNSSIKSTDVSFVAPTASSLDISLDRNKAKVGEMIAVTVIAKNSQGNIMPGAVVTFYTSNVKNRKGSAAASGAILLNGAAIEPSKIYTADASGKIILTMADSNGTGVSRTLNALSGAASVKTDYIFTVITSPDSSKSNMWGHMADVAIVGGKSFTRPKLAAEYPGHGSYDDTNELWSRPMYQEASEYCTLLGKSFASQADMKALYNAYPSNKINTVLGWPLSSTYHSSTVKTEGVSNWLINLSTGADVVGSGLTLRKFTVCN